MELRPSAPLVTAALPDVGGLVAARRSPSRGRGLWLGLGCCLAFVLGLVLRFDGPRPTVGVAAAQESKRLALQKTLRGDRQSSARIRAAGELGRMADTAALGALIQCLLGDRESEVRAACAKALGELGESAARPALRAATKDESDGVRKQAEAALGRLGPGGATPGTPPLPQRVTILVGKMGAKAKSGTMPDILEKLREAVLTELRQVSEIDIVEESKGGRAGKGGFTVDSSVTRLARRTTPNGELEISCDVSMIIAMLPAKNIVGMVSGGASVIGPRGPSAKPTKAFLEGLESDALTQAVHETHSSLMQFLRSQLSRMPQQQQQ